MMKGYFKTVQNLEDTDYLRVEHYKTYMTLMTVKLVWIRILQIG